MELAGDDPDAERALAEAEPLAREAMDGTVRVIGPDSADAMATYNVMSFLLRRLNRPAEAEPYLRRALEACERTLGADFASAPDVPQPHSCIPACADRLKPVQICRIAHPRQAPT